MELQRNEKTFVDVIEPIEISSRQISSIFIRETDNSSKGKINFAFPA